MSVTALYCHNEFQVVIRLCVCLWQCKTVTDTKTIKKKKKIFLKWINVYIYIYIYIHTSMARVDYFLPMFQVCGTWDNITLTDMWSDGETYPPRGHTWILVSYRPSVSRIRMLTPESDWFKFQRPRQVVTQRESHTLGNSAWVTLQYVTFFYILPSPLLQR